MGRVRLVRPGALLKRVGQLTYLCAHPLSHYRCASVIRRARLVRDRVTPLKYLGDHLSLSMSTPERRQALMGHYAMLPRILQPPARRQLRRGMQLWRKDLQHDTPPLSIKVEQARLAPMEGELQLTFSFRTELFALTFLLAPGRLFDVDAQSVLFIGGIQGRIGTREEMREASRLNGEISPAAMLILAIQAFADATGVDQLIAIGDQDHVSTVYSPSQILFDYDRFWKEVGGERSGRYYRIPVESPSKPLSEIPLTHRRRTRRKREARAQIRRSLQHRLRQILRPLSAKEPARRAKPAALRVSPLAAFS